MSHWYHDSLHYLGKTLTYDQTQTALRWRRDTELAQRPAYASMPFGADYIDHSGQRNLRAFEAPASRCNMVLRAMGKNADVAEKIIIERLSFRDLARNRRYGKHRRIYIKALKEALDAATLAYLQYDLDTKKQEAGYDSKR